jgi:hypothetical protein
LTGRFVSTDAAHEGFFDFGTRGSRRRSEAEQSNPLACRLYLLRAGIAGTHVCLERLLLLTVERPKGVEVRVFRIDVPFRHQKPA